MSCFTRDRTTRVVISARVSENLDVPARAAKPSAVPSGLPVSRGSYCASLQIENVRCFAERQTLSLTNPNGAPARWTIILGENGVGKTTLLQALAIAAGGVRYGELMFDFWEFEEGPG